MAVKISLLLADVDGTLVTKEKVLTPRAIAAVESLRTRGIKFALTSGRPPRGMEMLLAALKIDTPIAAFNGGLFVRPENLNTVVESRTLRRDVVQPVIASIEAQGLGVWIYQGTNWFVQERHGAHVDREEWTVKFPPTVVSEYTPEMLENVAKIVGVSDDLALVARCETMVQEQFAGAIHTKQSNASRENPQVSATRSQPYYLDVTHPDANKGAVVLALSRMFNLPPQEIATIGDGPNDVLMFAKSGFSVAMCQASDEVKKAATEVTTSSEDEGFANAVERFILTQT